MNKSSIVGFAAIAIIFNMAVFVNNKAPGIFFDANSLLIVLGGTIAVALIAYPYATLMRTIDFLIWGLIFKKKKDYLQISQDIAGARNSFLINQNYLASEESHPFLREAVLFLLNRNIDDRAFEEILKNRSEFFKKRYVDDALVLRSLVKYPIALGFLAAVVKGVSLFWNFEASTQSAVAHEAAMALVAIFWGLAVACFLFFPISDSANKAVEEDQELRNLIIDGMILIREKATDDYFQAYLRGYLNLNERSNFKIFSGKAGFPYTNITVPKVEAKEVMQTPSFMENRETRERESRSEFRNKQKPDPKPFEALKSIAIPKVVAPPQVAEAVVVVDEEQELDVESKETVIASVSEFAVATKLEPVLTTSLAPQADEEDMNENEVPNVEAVQEPQPEVEATQVGDANTAGRKRRKEKTEVPGHQDLPVQIEADAPTTDLKSFQFKDLRRQSVYPPKRAK